MKRVWQILTVFFCVLWVLTVIGLRPSPMVESAPVVMVLRAEPTAIHVPFALSRAEK